MEIDGADGRIAKRQKLSNGIAKQRRQPGQSRVFAPYRTVGLVSPTAVPFTSVPLGKTTFQITTSVGRSLQTYDLRRGLQLVFITRPQTPEAITATTAWKDKVFAAWGGESQDAQRGVWVFKRGKKEAELEMPSDRDENVKAFCIFGGWVVGVCETQLLVWKSATWELYTTLRGISPVPLTQCISSLPTFLNKVIVGRQDGSAEIWNVSSGKLVYTILPPSTAYGAVTAIEPTPALSLVAIAFEKGPLLVQDVRTDQTVMQLSTPTGAPIASISFRTDGLGAGEDGRSSGVMATASTASGDVTLWDLNNGGRKAGVLRAAHAQPTPTTPGGTSKVEFLSGQGILVSSGLDNSLKTWIFDDTPFSPIPRILHERRGHGAPVSKLMFLPTASDGSDDTGKWLLSSSKDRSLWGWSLRRDGQSTEISQGAVQKRAKKQGLLSGNRDFEDLKCPPITSMACCLNRDGGMGAIPGKHPIWQPAGKGKQLSAEISAMTGWESVLTAHESDNKARTWFWGRKRAGRWAFQTGDGSNVTSVTVSPCGTFGVVGSEKGGIDMFNMQSGIQRQRYPARLTPMQAKQLRLDVQGHGLVEEDDGKKKFYRGQGKHGAAVVGLAVDSLNKTIVSAGADGKVKFWDFNSGLLRHQIDWSSSTSITAMRFHRSSDLAALSCADNCIRVIDIATQKLIRELWPSRSHVPQLHKLKISDFTFSDDGRWIAASAGQVVFLWDLPTGHLVDAFKLKAECTSLAFSPTGDFLATATQDNVGVDIWTNRSLFTHIPTRHIGLKELTAILSSTDVQAPTASGEGGANLVADAADSAFDDEAEADILDIADDEVDQISSDLLSLSIVPRSRWQNLMHLDLIRQRNKPIEPPKKPEKAPFFLPSLQDRQGPQPIDPQAGASAAADIEKERTRVLQLDREGMRSGFTSLLHASAETEDYDPFLEHLKNLSPAAADIEIRSLSYENEEFVGFVRALTWRLQQKRDFELCQAWMAVFLKVHGDVVVGDEEVRGAVQEYRDALEVEKRRVQKLSGYVSGLVGYLRAARV
ncbi:U3 small nucleolar RNA-associated protein 21 [Fulvia fulva]|uniref:U3 small nucleolar RNA-associated protein 21 n=1 Tax=Passalora fulva TaxID=5499 RepID=A0A9Q8US74_PASFU|nr:U3 small nucleolar RNA-associated protein 21 [Fulvia fulva]KAK4619662.1 U3 small nucleolar RNA-associated protein 21 [Fulvia fulva]KAK4620522.1 U3 small nucleolar RNA-associated protein 21 [Fulvia fulva]UJO20472.1 U3 small nucleolar RNA-associated protein 21 [Fulvia fulva]WPV16836.1 U3 small nucleolar RNA-associated protein 21 [Fulvia fulva]WPV32196.1 U3 small nucleolar RNA-associated protein 21 [Fulvia fulva]